MIFILGLTLPEVENKTLETMQLHNIMQVNRVNAEKEKMAHFTIFHSSYTKYYHHAKPAT